MKAFSALRIHESPAGAARPVRAVLEPLTADDLSPGDVVIRVEWSGINYKDALAATGAGKILRRMPLVGGIDLAGTVLSSQSPDVREGDAVLVTGCGLSETRDGGYAQVARVPADSVVPLPPGFTARDAMVLGTAGFTAALAVMRLEHNGLAPGGAPVVVTGAAGGVGCIAVDLLAGRGYEVVASSRGTDTSGWLRALGAARVIAPADLAAGDGPLGSIRWAAAIDNVGGDGLAQLLKSTANNGGVAAVGLVAGSTLSTSVIPFLLRGVNLLGINSAATPRATRLAVWQRLATDLRLRQSDSIVTRTVTLDELPQAFDVYLEGRHRGRTLVRIAGSD
jgi:acrylyl-CoA reductase (NADPH)